MNKLIGEAMEALRHLPEDVQQAAARSIIDYGASQDDDLRLSDEQVIEVERRMKSPDRSLPHVQFTDVG